MPNWRKARVVLADLLGREVGEADGDVHRRDDQLDDLGEAVGVEGLVALVVVRRNFIRFSEARLQDELSRCMYSLHGLEAVIRPDSGEVCQWLMVSSYWMPGSAQACAASAILRKRDLASTSSTTSPVIRARSAELRAGLDGLHELVVHADRVVGVLVLDGGDVVAAQVHVEARVAQRADLLLLLHLGLDEGLDVRVVDVEDDHLGRAAGGATGLDGAGGGVGAAHEGDGTGGVAAGGEQLLGGADAGEVQAGAGAALEDHPLFLVPVEDRLHGVVDGEDEAGGDLLRLRGADVEPDRGVEAEDLVQQGVRQLVLEDLGVLGRGEVAVVLTGLRGRSSPRGR